MSNLIDSQTDTTENECGDSNPIISFEPASKKDFDRLKTRVDNLVDYVESVYKEFDSHRIRMDAIANNCDYLHDYLEANKQDHLAMLENCQRMLPLVKLVEKFINTYRPLLTQLQDQMNAPEGTECQTT